MDALSSLFLICFGVGSALLLLSLLTGVAHLPLHLGHVHAHAAGHFAHGPGGHGGGGHASAGADAVSPLNAMSLLIFLAWFGGVGYLLHGPLGAWGPVSLLGAALAGLAGAALVFLFLARVLAPRSTPLDPADFRLEGQVGRVSVPIRSGGVGEVLYSQRGRRRVIGARAAADRPLGRGTEVVIVGVEHGLALVEPWEQFIAKHAARVRGAGGALDARPAAAGDAKEDLR